jgi:hypothetical protein
MNDSHSISSRDELLELAALDALGVLDAVESARFERAFDAAVPSLQAEARSIQDKVALDPMLLSDEAAPASLRLRTLARVADAIEADAAAPIATIGPVRTQRASGASAQLVDRDALVREVMERAAREQRPRQHIWRAASLFLFAALLVALYFNSQQRELSERLVAYADNRMVDEAVRALARTTKSFDFTAAREVAVFENGMPVQGVHAFFDDASNRMVVYGLGVSSDSGTARVVCGADANAVMVVAAVVENRGFSVMFDVPRDSAGAAPKDLRVQLGSRTLEVRV